MKPLKFISDQEIDLNQSDFLKTKVYADNLVDIIKNTEKDKVFTVGLYGSWGSGKSSIIETSKKSFDEKKDKIKFITYDAWQYSNDSFRRMFLRCLSKELKYTETDFMKRFYENESKDIDNEFKLSYTKSVYVLIGLIGLLFILSFFKFEIHNKISVFSIITLLGTLIALFSGVFHQLKVSVTKPYVFAPEQFEDCFKEIAYKALKTNTIFDKLKYINDYDFTVKDLTKLVIVIDNIDRCNSEIAYQLLTDIKTFLGSQRFSIVFIIPVDDKALLKNFFSKNKSGSEHIDKEEFLRKIFNVTLRIKPYNSTDMFAFTKAICISNDLKLKNETIIIIGKEYSSNPRRVIQLLNNLMVELNSYDDHFATIHESLICCILIIREEYSEFYEKVYKNASLLINYNTTKLEEELESQDKFMRTAITEFQYSSNGILNTILMNSDNHFKALPIELVEMIDSFDKNKLTEFLKENEEIDEEVYNYLCHKIDEAHDNELKNDLSKYIQFIGVINLSKNIPTQYLLKIFEKFKSKIETVFFYGENLEILMKLVAFQNENYNKYKIKNTLLDLIANRINTSDEKVKARWIVIFNSLLTNLIDDETSNKIKHDYGRFYSELISVEKIKDGQFKILVNDTFIINRVNEINSTDLEDKKYKEVKIILNRHEDKLFVVEEVFKRFNSESIYKNDLESRFWYVNIFNDFIINSPKEQITNYNGKYLEKNLQTIFSDILSDKNNTPIIGLKLFDEIEKDKSKTEELLHLIKSYYDFTGNTKTLEKYLIEINRHIPEAVRVFIVKLLNERKDIKFYFEETANSSNYADDNLIVLLKHFLTSEDTDFNIINRTKFIRIIEGLMIWIKDDEFTPVVNEIIEFEVNKNNSFDLAIDGINKYISGDKNLGFLNFFSNKLKEEFANNFEKIVIADYQDEQLLKLAFELNNNNLNYLLLDKISESTNTVTIFDSLLIKALNFIGQYSESDFTPKFKEIIQAIQIRLNINLKSNLPVYKRIKLNLTKMNL
ncbi:P-loop NTPase fold protein [Flavobacterium sp.]